MYSDNDYRLYHFGIKGQKWGTMHGPPYPLDSSISTGKRLRDAAGKIKEHVKKRRAESAVKRAENKAKREEKKAQAWEEKKEKIIRTGDFDKIDKLKSKLSDDEFQRAIARVNLNEQLKDAHPKSSFDRAMDKVYNFRNSVEKGISAWNTFAKIVNSFDEDGGSLPVLDGEWASKKAEEREKSAREAKKEADQAMTRTLSLREKQLSNQAKTEEIIRNRDKAKLDTEAAKLDNEKKRLENEAARNKNKWAEEDREESKWDNKRFSLEEEREPRPSHYTTLNSGGRKESSSLHWLSDDEAEMVNDTPFDKSSRDSGRDVFDDVMNRRWNNRAIDVSQPLLLEDKQRRAS